MIIEGYFFLFCIETICCDHSSELSCQDSLDEGYNICFYAEFTNPPNTPSYLEL